MILVLLGTFHIEFRRPLIEIDNLFKSGILNEKLIAQTGHTQFTTNNFEQRPFIAPDDLEQLYDQARVIITHAGTGSIIKGVKKGKKMIAIARLKKYAEHIDDHQLEILNEFASLGYIMPWREDDSLAQLMADVDSFTPRTYVSQNKTIVNYLKGYIDSL
jgi:UDP-N-acetylglucosamine transferase subunit ALG13